MVKIKHCPFCGGKAELKTQVQEHDFTVFCTWWHMVECQKCRILGNSYEDKSKAIDSWNRRYFRTTKEDD